MNIDLDISAVTGFLRKVATELREKRLWPVALVLVVAIVAVPIALSNNASPAPVAAGPAPTPPPSQATSLPAISEQSTPSQSHLSGRARNPFTQQISAKSSTTASSATTTSTSTHVTSTATSTGGAAANGGSTSTGSVGSFAPPTSKPVTPPSITQSVKPKPAPSGLTSTQSYDVTLAITTTSGGLNTINSLERLSALPNAQTPMLVEMGVLQGGTRVLFAVQPGTVVNGPGVCTPGPIDCEILSLAPGQTEGMSKQTPSGLSQGPLFAVTGITTAGYRSAAAANAARRAESSAGRQLLAHSTLTALSLFQYQPSLGTMVDLRNLTVGGN